MPSGNADFDWPPVPYSQFLRQQLAEHTQYEYINPSLDRRYDPVVVGGNAMHPVIQRSDVILIDTGNKEPADGQPVAVRVGGGRTLIGYWRDREGKPVLEQERTDAVIDLSQYPNWSVYGVVTKIIGRGIPPHPTPPDIASGPEEPRMDVTPGQAQWIVERLLADGRISAKDVSQYLDAMRGEIRDIERRLALLRDARSGPAASPAPRSAPPIRKTRKGKGEQRPKASGHPRGIAGTLAVLLRSIPAAEHAAIQAIRADQGIQAAIKAARIAVGK
ncbi:MAG: S24/S26 family peptidase [Acidobacteria bacterium]|nr:S24/S26 family peptidase [Acidobacteriota bacterium]MBV9069007.1 S24/S26 family peptidase [Acidobacteriota bacterium]MBV9184197.1 S24/S26 family peptidase [Acidobacteriota bacterium]